MTNYDKENASSIQAMFASIAKEYDKANAMLSFNMHRLWNKKLVTLTAKQSLDKHPILLDLCAGTGEIAKEWLNLFDAAQKVHLLDFCPEMLAVAKKKMDHLPHELDYIHGSAEKIALSNQSVDAITVAYGIRNVCNIDSCFQESYRVLKPGGTFAILELTTPKSALLKSFHKFYLKNVLPLIGGLVTKNAEAYQYLCQSIQNFIEPEKIKNRLLQAGYSEVHIHPLTLGISTVILAKKS